MTVDALRPVLADQLSRPLSALKDLDPARDVVLLAEVAQEASYVPHHPKKIAFLFSAMRHFAAALRADGVRVDYVTLDDPDNTGSLRGELLRAAARHRPARVVACEPGEQRVLDDMAGWREHAGVPVEIRADDRFYCSRGAFARWAKRRGQLRMEFFYRAMRRKTGILMDGDEPTGGRWNYDAQNRRPLPSGTLSPPDPLRVAPDAITEEVLELVGRRFGNNFGALRPFRFAVTRAQALEALEVFVNEALPRFGDYQDAMRQGDDYLYHSALSQYMNAGLLLAREVVDRVERAYHKEGVPLNAAEGYIRQILGWREFVRGVYWLRMPEYRALNHLNANRPLPAFYWSGETDLNCLRQVIDQTRREAHSHHIQRLMITGNFAMLAGVRPEDINEWYLAVYADAYEWVELPNTHGMATFADGGVVGSKPYAAGGNYINKMSDFCRHCRYNVRARTGDDACPFNHLYWTFLAEHRDKLGRNPRLLRQYSTLDRLDPKEVDAMRGQSRAFLGRLEPYRR